MSSQQITSDALMRLLIPEGKVQSVAKAARLSESLIYQERRMSGDTYNATGTRNTLDRLDIFCELALSWNPNAVGMVAERYSNLYNNALAAPENVTVATLLSELGSVSKECGEAIAALATRQCAANCAVEVSQAKEALERALRVLAALETQA